MVPEPMAALRSDHRACLDDDALLQPRRRIDMSARRDAGFAGQRMRRGGGRKHQAADRGKSGLRLLRDQDSNTGLNEWSDVGGAQHGGGLERRGKTGVPLAFDIDKHALAAFDSRGDAANLDAGMLGIDEFGPGQIRDLNRRIPACRHEKHRIGHMELYPDRRPPSLPGR